MLKRELLKLIEEDPEFRDIVRARLGVAELLTVLQALSQSLSKLAAALEGQTVASAAVAEGCKSSLDLLRSIAKSLEEQKSLLQEATKGLEELQRISQEAARGEDAVREAVTSSAASIVEELKKQNELFRRVLASLQLL